MELTKKLIFNEHGDDSLEHRQLFGGNSTGIMNLNSVRYSWATKLYKIMLNNHWIPEKVSLVEDKITIKELTNYESESFKSTISFLIALDSMQVANIPNLAEFITAPEVSSLFTLQAFQELIHSQSYQYILLELFPSNEREEIYNLWRNNPALLKRNKAIAEKYQRFIDDKSIPNYKVALAANYALEGIYFYSGFNFFYQLASRNKAVGVAAMIKYIENDELTHVSMYSRIIKEEFNLEDPADVELLRTILIEACEEEIAWGITNYGDNILGISPKSTEEHIKFLGNQRARTLGLGVLFKGFNTNPYEYLNAEKRANFFEASAVTEYSQSAAVSGWDSF